MPMQAESLKVLEKASVAPAQARAIVRAIEIEIAGAQDTLATKHDVLELRSEIKQATAELRAEIARSDGGVVRQMCIWRYSVKWSCCSVSPTSLPRT